MNCPDDRHRLPLPAEAREFRKVFDLADQLTPEAQAMPGFISRKVYHAEDGERVTVIELEFEETHRAWTEHHGHRAAQKLGREKFYSEYTLQICPVLRTSTFPTR